MASLPTLLLTTTVLCVLLLLAPPCACFSGYALNASPTHFSNPAPASLTAAQNSPNACDVTAYGAKGDNSTLNTFLIQRAINDCHTRFPFASMVVVPAGVYLTGSVNLTSNMTLYLGSGAVFYGSHNVSDYAVVPAMPPGGGGMWSALVAGYNVSNVRVTGEQGGALDGAGWPFWCAAAPPHTRYDFCHLWPSWINRTLAHQRPKLLEFVGCRNVEVSAIELRNSAFWTFHPIYSQDIHAFNLTVQAPRAVGNTDGIDPSSCADVLVENCLIDVGDDGISIKSFNASDDAMLQVPCQRVHMRNLTILSRNWCVGSATYGGVKDILFEDSRVGDDLGSSPWAIKFKSHRYYPGVLENIMFRRLRLGKITGNTWQQPGPGHAFLIGLTYGGQPPKGPRAGVPVMRNVSFVDIAATWADIPGDMSGLPESLLQELSFDNVTIPTHGAWGCNYVAGDYITHDVQPPLDCSPSWRGQGRDEQ
jgi:polygalacturonase